MVDERVRADLVINLYHFDLGRWEPPQRLGEVAWPNMPHGVVAQFNDVALVVPCDMHVHRSVLI